MHFQGWSIGVVMALVGVAAFTAGCHDANNAAPRAANKETEKSAQVVQKQDTHDHGGWWCAEHGVPEEICGQCSAKVAAECKKKGDWCKEHDRPDSQCFVHHPELKEKFAAQYRAKYGKEPPPLEDEEKNDNHKKKSNG
jgi:hypothetical protein